MGAWVERGSCPRRNDGRGRRNDGEGAQEWRRREGDDGGAGVGEVRGVGDWGVELVRGSWRPTPHLTSPLKGGRDELGRRGVGAWVERGSCLRRNDERRGRRNDERRGAGSCLRRNDERRGAGSCLRRNDGEGERVCAWL